VASEERELHDPVGPLTPLLLFGRFFLPLPFGFFLSGKEKSQIETGDETAAVFQGLGDCRTPGEGRQREEGVIGYRDRPSILLHQKSPECSVETGGKDHPGATTPFREVQRGGEVDNGQRATLVEGDSGHHRRGRGDGSDFRRREGLPLEDAGRGGKKNAGGAKEPALSGKVPATGRG
jgi:hypothetical protein